MIKIYGHSDDSVVVQGDITEEFHPDPEDESSYLALSDGTVLSIHYDKEGIWRINRLVAGSASFSKIEDDGSERSLGSDVVTLDADIVWVLGGEVFARRKAAVI